MKYLIAFSFILFSSNSFGQQTIDSLKKISNKIIGKSSTKYEHDMEQEKQLASILNLDVITYYDLKERFNSPLKIKLFKETEEYNNKLSELTKIKTSTVNKTFYIDYELSVYDKENFKLNTAVQTFSFLLDTEVSEYSNPNEILFDHISLNKVSGISSKSQILSVGSYEYARQKIELKVANLNRALEIEENANDLKMIFVFKFQSTKAFMNDVSGMFSFQDYILKALTQKIIIYNKTNNKVFISYDASKTIGK